MQDGINVQDGKIPKINKRAGWNKAVQVGIFQKLLLWKPIWGEKFQKLINVQDGIRVCRLDFFKKIISCAARLLDRPEYILAKGHILKEWNSYWYQLWNCKIVITIERGVSKAVYHFQVNASALMHYYTSMQNGCFSFSGGKLSTCNIFTKVYIK